MACPFFDGLLFCFFKIAERVKLSKTRSESSSSDRPVLGSEISSIGVSVHEQQGQKAPSGAAQTVASRSPRNFPSSLPGSQLIIIVITISSQSQIKIHMGNYFSSFKGEFFFLDLKLFRKK